MFLRLEFYLFYCDAFLKDCVLFKSALSSIEIAVIVVKRHVFLNFVERHEGLKIKRKNINIIIIIYVPI